MASVDSTEEGSLGLFRSIWRKLKAHRRWARARNLAHVRFRLTREGVHFTGILAFIFIGAVIREISLLILLAGAMIGLLILQWRFNTSTLVGLTVRRRVPRSTTAGRETEVEIKLTNPKAWLSAWLVQSEDKIQRKEPESIRVQETGTALFDTVRPKGMASSNYSLQFHERGEYTLGPTVLQTRFPLGLGMGWRTLDNSSTIIVHPRQGELTQKVSSLFHLEQLGRAKSSSKSGNQEGEFFGLRPWASGDSKRWIHWRTTARLDKLSVRQFEQQQQKQITVLLDLFDSSEESSKEHQEAAISFIATLAARTVALGQDKIAIGIAANQSSSYPSILSSLMVQNVLRDLAVANAVTDVDFLGTMRGLSVPILTHPQLLVVSTRANILPKLQDECEDASVERLLTMTRVRWIDVSSGELEPYFQWT